MKTIFILIALLFTKISYSQKYVTIPLGEDLIAGSNEFSGLAVNDGNLYLLSEKGPNVYFFDLKEIDRFRYSKGKSRIPQPKRCHFVNLEVVKNKINNFEGLEAILFFKKEVFFTVESHGSLSHYLIKGVLKQNKIVLDTNIVASLPNVTLMGRPIQNAGYESLGVWNNTICSLYEFNNSNDSYLQVVNLPHNKDHLRIPIKPIPFRITDMTTIGNKDQVQKLWTKHTTWPV